MQIDDFASRPARHRALATTFRILALALWIVVIFGDGPAPLAQLFASLALLLIAAVHDLVAATLRPKVLCPHREDHR